MKPVPFKQFDMEKPLVTGPILPGQKPEDAVRAAALTAGLPLPSEYTYSLEWELKAPPKGKMEGKKQRRAGSFWFHVATA